MDTHIPGQLPAASDPTEVATHPGPKPHHFLLVYCLAFGFALAIGFAHEYAAAGALNLPAS